MSADQISPKYFYLHKNGYESGPFDLPKLQSMLNEKIINPADLVWCEGMPEWKPVGELLQSRRNSHGLKNKAPKAKEHHFTPSGEIYNSPRVSYAPVVVLGIVVILVASYIASPFLAIYDLKQALISGEAERLRDRIDFPEIRQSLKEQIKASFMEELAKDEEQNALATGLAAAFGPVLIDGIVDSIITPTGISNLIWNAKFPSPRKDGEPMAEPSNSQKDEHKPISFSHAWFTGPTTFKTVSKDKGLVLRLHLKDFKWKLYNIEIPRA